MSKICDNCRKSHIIWWCAALCGLQHSNLRQNCRWKVHLNENNHIKSFHLGRYISRYIVWNYVLWLRWRLAVKLNLCQYIRRYTSTNKELSPKGYSRKNYLGGEDSRWYIFLWVVGAESFQIIWVIAVWPNQITWIVGISLGWRGRKNIVCQKREVLSNLAKKSVELSKPQGNRPFFVYTQSSKLGCFRRILVKNGTQINSPIVASVAIITTLGKPFFFIRIYSRKHRYRVVWLIKVNTCKNLYQ